MPRFGPSIGPDHPDFELLSRLAASVSLASGGQNRLLKEMPRLLQEAIDFVVDPVLTARTTIAELDNVEKTFIGLKVEHYLRDFLGFPKGLRDLNIDGIDVDVKNTVSSTWMIPPETFRNEEPCLLIAIADADKQFWLGLIVAKNEYLGSAAGNRDAKRQITSFGRSNILWLAECVSLPDSSWVGIDMARFRDLRKLKGGRARAAQFFRENLGTIVHRNVLQALLFEQKDFLKRLRKNGGARDILIAEDIIILSGIYDRNEAIRHGFPLLTADEFVAVRSIK